MKGYNIIVVFDETAEKVLMCRRRKKPYQGLANFVGGKINKGESGIDAAYRELEEETSITRQEIELCSVMDFIYHLDNYYLEVYVGKLKTDREVSGEENELFWCSRDKEFFDTSEFAGEGNIGHIMKYIDVAAERVFS